MNDHHFDKRIAAIQSALSLHDCDAFISVDPTDNAYLTGFFGSASALLITQANALLLCDFRYAEQAAAQTRVATVMQCAGNLDLRLAEKLADAQARRSAFEPDAITVSRHDAIAKKCGSDLVPTPGICRTLRLCKEPGERERIAASAALAEDALETLLACLEPGIHESTAAGQLEFEFRKRGAQCAAFETIVLFGERSSLPHGKPGERALQTGDIVLIDCGCILDGYCSDLTRTFVFGRIPGEWFVEIYEITRIAQQSAVETTRAGVLASDVDAAARDTIAAAGYGERFGHGTGHGVGLEVHEAPRLNAESHTALKAGMAVTVEPGIYLPGRGGVRIEDLIVVTENGNDVLTRLPKELRIL